MTTQTLQIHVSRPCTQLDLDRLVRRDAVLKQIEEITDSLDVQLESRCVIQIRELLHKGRQAERKVRFADVEL